MRLKRNWARGRGSCVLPQAQPTAFQGGDETFCILPGASRACADFCDPTAVSRFKANRLYFPFKEELKFGVKLKDTVMG